MRRTWTVGLLLAAAVAGSAAKADEGRIAVYRTTEIAEPGSYVLTRDVSATGGETLRISSDGVVLDLNGHTLEANSANAITVADGVTEVTIRNGRITGASTGIAYATTSLRGRIRIENIDVVTPAAYGIYVSGAASVEIRSCHVTSPGLDGIYVDGQSGSFGGRFVENTIEGAARDGMYLRGLRGGELRRNLISGAGGAGIQLEGDSEWSSGGNLVEDNTIRAGGGAAAGIEIGTYSPTNIVSRNVVTGNGQQGLLVASWGNRIAENEVSGNGADGVRIDGSYNVIERNHLTGNQYGLRMACTNSKYRDNVMLGNTTFYCTGPCCGTGNAGGNLN